MRMILVLFAALLFGNPAFAAPQTYLLEKGKSKVGFSWYLGKQKINGAMPVSSANIVLDLDRLQDSKVTVAVNVKKARAGFPFATQGLKSEKVLWAKKYPEIVFIGTKFRRNGDRALIDGRITIRGVTKPATFEAQLFRQAGSSAGNNRNLSVRLKSTVSRSAFGATGWPKLAGDKVELDIVANIKQAS